MSSVGFSSQLPSVTDFLSNQGAYIDTHILMAVIGAANADSISKTVAAQAARLAGLMSRADAIIDTQKALGNIQDKIAKPELDKIDKLDADWAAREKQNPVPAIGKTPNLSTWEYGKPLTYSDDADAKWLQDRGLPVEVYVPAQSKTFTITNPDWTKAKADADAAKALYDSLPAEPKAIKQAAYDDWQKKLKIQNDTPKTIDVTQTAPQIGTPDAYEKNRETIAKYKASLLDGTADNPVINDLTKNNAELGAATDAVGVEKPTKFKQVGEAVVQMLNATAMFTASIDQAREELLAFVDKAGAAFDFLNNLAADLGKDGLKQVDKLTKQAAALDGINLGPLDPHTRAIVEDALLKLANVTPPGDAKAALEKLPPDQQREALKQISTFQKELEALLGTSAPPTNAPSFQTSSRLMRV